MTTIVLLLFVAAGTAGADGKDKKEDKKEPTQANFEEAYRAWDKGFASDKKEDREKTLRSMYPTKKDVEYLFPKHVEKLWPLIVELQKEELEHVDELAKEFARGGAINKVKIHDMRKDKEESYKRVLAIIPKDVGVFEITVDREKEVSYSGTFLFRDGRWFWIGGGFDKVPDELDKLK